MISYQGHYLGNAFFEFLSKHHELPTGYMDMSDMPSLSDADGLAAYIGFYATSESLQWEQYIRVLTQYKLEFNPQLYRWFDRVIVHMLYEKHPEICSIDYGYYTGLQHNLAVLRNLLLYTMFSNQSVDQILLEKKLHQLAHIAMETGLLLGSPDTTSLIHYNQICHGGALLYGALQAALAQPSHHVGFALVKDFFRKHQQLSTLLPAIEHTPFAYPPLWQDIAETTQKIQHMQYEEESLDPMLLALAQSREILGLNEFDTDEKKAVTPFDINHAENRVLQEEKTYTLENIEDLRQDVKEEAIAIAMDILDKLRLKFAEMTIDMVMSAGDLPMIKELMDGAKQVAHTFSQHMLYAAKAAPELLTDTAVLDANEAVGIFRYHEESHVLGLLELDAAAAEQAGNLQLAAELRARAEDKRREIEAMPALWKQAGDKTIATMLDKLETGLTRVVNKMQQMSQTGSLMMVSDDIFKGRDKPQEKEKDKEKGHERSKEDEHAKEKDKEEQKQKKNTNERDETAKKQEKDHKKLFVKDVNRDALVEQQRRRQEERLRRARRRQERARQEEARDKAKQAGKRHKLQAKQAAEEMKEGKARAGVDMHHDADHGFGNLLDASSLKGLQQGMKAMSDMEVPEDLMPNSAARVIKTIQKQRSAIKVSQHQNTVDVHKDDDIPPPPHAGKKGKLGR